MGVFRGFPGSNPYSYYKSIKCIKNIPKLNGKPPNPTPTFLWLLPYLPWIHFIGKDPVIRQRFFCYFSIYIVHENNVYYDAVIIIGKYLTSGCVKRYVGRKTIKYQ